MRVDICFTHFLKRKKIIFLTGTIKNPLPACFPCIFLFVKFFSFWLEILWWRLYPAFYTLLINKYTNNLSNNLSMMQNSTSSFRAQMPAQFSKVIMYYVALLPSPQCLEGQREVWKWEKCKCLPNWTQKFTLSFAPRAYAQRISLLTTITPILQISKILEKGKSFHLKINIGTN